MSTKVRFLAATRAEGLSIIDALREIAGKRAKAAQSDRVVNIAVTKAEHPVREVNIVVTGSGAKVPVEAGAFEYPEPPAGLDRRRKLQ